MQLMEADAASPDPTSDVRLLYRDLIGLTELGALLAAVRNHPDFDALLPHLRLLNDGTSLQNIPSPQRDSASNLLFELFTALLIMPSGSEVVLDDPRHSTGSNPDVLATIDRRRWGFACKVIHSSHPEAFIARLEEGLVQLERSEAELGVVFFNLKNVIDHERYWPLANKGHSERQELPVFSAFVDGRYPSLLLRQEVQSFASGIAGYLPPGRLKTMFSGRKSVPGALFWGHTAAGIMVNDGMAPASIRVMSFQRVAPVDQGCLDVFRAMQVAAYADFTAGGS